MKLTARDTVPDGRKVRMSETDRFWTKVQKTDSCWLWLGARSRGYGGFNRKPGPRMAKAHRVAYEFMIGPIPEGLELDHLCRVRHCVNPAHLEPVPKRINILRGDCPQALNARKTHCVHGHEFTETNTCHVRTGGRRCRACNRDRMRVRQALQKAGT